MSSSNAAEWKDEFGHYLRVIFWRLAPYLPTYQQQLSMCLLGGKNLLDQPAIWAVKNNFIAWKIVGWHFSCPSFCQTNWEQSKESLPKFCVESPVSSWGLKPLSHIIFWYCSPMVAHIYFLQPDFCWQNCEIGTVVNVPLVTLKALFISLDISFVWKLLYKTREQNTLQETDRYTRKSIYAEILA